jgi:hypothetical protein
MVVLNPRTQQSGKARGVDDGKEEEQTGNLNYILVFTLKFSVDFTISDGWITGMLVCTYVYAWLLFANVNNEQHDASPAGLDGVQMKKKTGMKFPIGGLQPGASASVRFLEWILPKGRGWVCK